MKRAAAKKLIERYFYQLTDGCGNPSCDNKFCASSGEVRNCPNEISACFSFPFTFQLKPLTPDEAAAQAIQLFSQEARLCERHPNKIARKQSSILSTKNSVTSPDICLENDTLPTNDIVVSSTDENSKYSIKFNCGEFSSANTSNESTYFVYSSPGPVFLNGAIFIRHYRRM